MLKHLIIAMRPKQMVKNGIIFGPLVFSNNLRVLNSFLYAATALACFCLLSGAVYLINDIADLEKDRNHPLKRLRPLPAGLISKTTAVVAAALCIPLALGGAFYLGVWVGVFASLYLAVNLGYSFYLKRIVLIDVGCIAFGFVLRVLAGAAVIGVTASPWMVMCTILLALFLGFAKRRNELVLLGEDKASHRKVLEQYTPELLDQMLIISAAAAIMSYALYTIAPATTAHFGTENLIYTVPFVIYGIFRYLYIIHVMGEGGDPSKVLVGDHPLQACIVLWLTVCVLIVEGVL